MQIDRQVFEPASRTGAHCPLACTDCSGLCLAVYMMLTPAEQDAVFRQHRVAEAAGPFGHC